MIEIPKNSREIIRLEASELVAGIQELMEDSP